LADKGSAQFKPIYDEGVPLFEKVRTIAREIYRADDVVADKSVRDQFKAWEAAGYGNFPICMAKTQYSFSTDPNLKGAPINHMLPVREVRLSAGAEFIVVICGDIMTMPGLPKVPSAEVIGLDEKGQIAGLF
jgi:formate--tetrahydrofolate ligase